MWFASVSDILEFVDANELLDARPVIQASVHHKSFKRTSYSAAALPRGPHCNCTASSRTITERSPSKPHCKRHTAARMASQASKPTVTVLDYGAGNVRSVINALELLGCNVDLVRTAKDVRAAEILVFPGVGCFAAAMDALDLSLIHI